MVLGYGRSGEGLVIFERRSGKFAGAIGPVGIGHHRGVGLINR
ncbi:MAG TPA: hypothetical protein V6D46_00890 [Coleofasciculaceae cyanobacterium]